jgi:hypothetical protein
MQEWSAIVAELQSLLNLCAQDVRAGMAVNYPDRK